ncbi:unnamed protein product [Brachionus calyciflorus]|uniref:Uncharacterized protein n=1 Tax=Brachionus calyciflorus TaxID=104777 RepID=A0A813Y1R6_9BILA|nr:unnamed protein product [Brachionus calyciflorus]
MFIKLKNIDPNKEISPTISNFRSNKSERIELATSQLNSINSFRLIGIKIPCKNSKNLLDEIHNITALLVRTECKYAERNKLKQSKSEQNLNVESDGLPPVDEDSYSELSESELHNTLDDETHGQPPTEPEKNITITNIPIISII